jgi:hypothetical protein
MVKQNEPHPTASLTMYSDLIGNASEKYSMEMLFTDFLCYRGPEMGSYSDGLPDGEEGEHTWLGGQALAAQAHGVEVQFCMALAHHILMSADWPSVTNARVNGDGGLEVAQLTLPALLAATVGLGWSKDNLRTTDKCYVAGLFPNGTVKWPCGSINQREGTSGKYTMQVEQTILAALSLGPVGISDQLTTYPTKPDAKITSNKTLVMATCAASGDLLQPSYPITPLDKQLMAYTNGDAPKYALWGSYTAVASTSPIMPLEAPPNLWYLAFAFGGGKDPEGGSALTLFESDLAPMVDSKALPAPRFDEIPIGAFAGAGTRFRMPLVSLATSRGGRRGWRKAWRCTRVLHLPVALAGAVGSRSLSSGLWAHL